MIIYVISNPSDGLYSKRARIRNSILTFYFFVTLAVCTAFSQSPDEWPSFHGSDRSNKSAETGLMKEWPSGGPKLLWTISSLGNGYCSVSVGNGFIYTAGLTDNQTMVFAFDLNGKLVWKKPNGKAWSTTASWAVSYTGSRSTPTYSDGVVYHLGETGRLVAFDSKTGREIWYRELTKDFEAGIPEYGYSESVVIDGDKLYTRPSGKKGYQVCLNKRNGELIWANTDIQGSEGYSSMVIMNYGGFRQIIGSSSNCYYSVDTNTGKLLWKVDFENQRGLNVTDAIVYNEYVFITSGYGKGSMLVKLKISGKEIVPEKVWQTELMDNHHGGVIYHNGYLYGSGTNSRGWFCLDFLSGKQIWNTDGKGSVTYADSMLYLLDERSGSMRLVKAIPGRYELAGEFKVPRGGEGMYWAHPVVCGGRVYIRHSDKLFVYDIRGK
jgi:outer membrane protein assembly factor BamB